jgi:hypothetical protein
MTEVMEPDCNSPLNLNEKIKYRFQNSIKLHFYNFPLYFLITFIFSIVTQAQAQMFGINWNSGLFYLPFFLVIIYFELDRRNTHYYITNQRIIKETNFLHNKAKNFYFTEFIEIYTYSKWGTFLGYDNLHLKRKGFVNNFFNQVIIGGLDKKVANKILETLVDETKSISNK